MNQIYLAARYSRRLELCGYRDELSKTGRLVQARWLNGEHQLSNEGNPIGEDGVALVEKGLRSGEKLSEHEQSRRASELRAKFAQDDWEDVCSAGLVISFTEQPRSSASRGGRHVEFGIALGKGTPVMIVGPRENIFHWLPNVRHFEDWNSCFRAMNQELL